MNKNTKVLEAEYNEEGIFFLKIYKVYNIEYAPYILNSLYKKRILMIKSLEVVYLNGLKEEEYQLLEIN